MPASKDVDTTRKLEDTLNGTTTETGEEGAKRPPGGCQQRRNFFAVSNELKSRVFGSILDGIGTCSLGLCGVCES